MNKAINIDHMIFSKESLHLLIAMTEKEIKTQYKKTLLGISWAFINPLFQMLIIGLVFSYFIKTRNYFLFLFSGILPWSCFSSTVSKATQSFVAEKALLYKANFAKEIIPLSVMLSKFFHLLLNLLILVFGLVVFGKFSFINIFILLLGVVWLFVLSLGIIFTTSALNVRYRDIVFIVQQMMTFLFYATPVIYPFDIMPEKIRIIFAINPLTSIFEMFHISLTNSGSLDFVVLGFNAAITLIVLLIGIRIFNKNKNYLIDWL